MNVARDLLDDLAMIGATIEPAGDRLILRAGPTAIPAGLVGRIREAKAELLVTLATRPTDRLPAEEGGAAPDAEIVAPSAWFRRAASPAIGEPSFDEPCARASRPSGISGRACFCISAPSAVRGVRMAMASICARVGWVAGTAPRIGRKSAARDDR